MKNEEKEEKVDFDRDDLEEELVDMDYKDLKAFVKDNEIETETPIKKKTFDDDQEDIIEEILDAMRVLARDSQGCRPRGNSNRERITSPP